MAASTTVGTLGSFLYTDFRSRIYATHQQNNAVDSSAKRRSGFRAHDDEARAPAAGTIRVLLRHQSAVSRFSAACAPLVARAEHAP